MNVVDSCGWLEFFGAGSNTEFFRAPLQDTAQLIVPSITVYEVCRRTAVLLGDAAAARAFEFMRQGRIVSLEPEQMLAASLAAGRYRLAMADAIIWQTAQIHQAPLFTQDADLQNLPGVRYQAKPIAKSTIKPTKSKK